MNTVGGKTLLWTFFWAVLVAGVCAIALGGIALAEGHSCRPYRASSQTARLVDGRIVESSPVTTAGCR